MKRRKVINEEIMSIKKDYTRDDLIEICEEAIVQHNEWMNRDTPDCQAQVGLAWAMLNAGCRFTIDEDTDEYTIWFYIYWSNFSDFENGCREAESAQEYFYLPTLKRLEITKGSDWY